MPLAVQVTARPNSPPTLLVIHSNVLPNNLNQYDRGVGKTRWGPDHAGLQYILSSRIYGRRCSQTYGPRKCSLYRQTLWDGSKFCRGVLPLVMRFRRIFWPAHPVEIICSIAGTLGCSFGLEVKIIIIGARNGALVYFSICRSVNSSFNSRAVFKKISDSFFLSLMLAEEDIFELCDSTQYIYCDALPVGGA